MINQPRLLLAAAAAVAAAAAAIAPTTATAISAPVTWQAASSSWCDASALLFFS
jgi:hypothetical protein